MDANGNSTGYPWSSGDVLLAADLNSAIANASSIGAAIVGRVIGSDQFQLKSDFVQLSGTISWSNNIVTITGANFTAADVGKLLIMPCGPGVGVYGDPALVKITGIYSPTSCNVDTNNPTHPFTGSLQINNNAVPTITDPGAGGAHVGDIMVMQGGVFARPATFGVIQTKALTAPTVVSAGGGGMPLATVYLRATTGHGRRPLFVGKTDANGRLDLTQVPPLSLVDGGALYQDLADNTHEPLAADQRQLVFPGSWAAGATQITVSSGVLGTILPQLLRVGMSVSAVSDTAGVSGIVGGVGGSVITAIDVTDPHLITIAPAAVAAGTNQDITFASNRARLTVHAAFNAGDTTLNLTDGPLPGWVQDGTLISGTGIYGGGDPAGDPAAQTTFTVNPLGRTQIFLSQPTTAAAVQPIGLLINPALTGVVANIACVPVQLIVKDRGVYTTVPSSAMLTNGAVSCTITPYQSPEPLIVGMGTDNAAAIDAFASAARAATTSALQEDAALGIEVIWRPGNYLSTGSANFTNLSKPGLRLKFHGVVLHSAVPPQPGAVAPLSPLGRIALDFRKMRWGVLDQPTVTGDQYFPPYVGMAFGRFDIQPSDGSNIYNPIAHGRFLFAAITIQNTETTFFFNIDTANTEVPPAFPPLVPVAVAPLPPSVQLQARPVFCIVIDGDQHWDMPCEFIGTAAPLHKGDHQSFLQCHILGASGRGNGGCIPWAIGGAQDLVVDAGYSDTNGPPAILWFGDGTNSQKINIHCEANFTSDPDAKGLQDNIMLAGLKNSILQFNANYYEPVTQARNAVFTYDHEGYYGGVRDVVPGGPPQGATPYTGGLRGGILSTAHSTVEVGFTKADVQFFDRMRPAVRLIDGTTLLNMRDLSVWIGDLITNGPAYTAIGHFMNMPGQRVGRTVKGDLSQDMHYNGAGNFNSLALDGGILIGQDITSFPGANNYFASVNIGVSGAQTYGHWDNQRLQLGVRGSVAHPSTAPAIIGFAPPGNTALDGGPILDHSILVASPGTLDISGSGPSNAYVRINGTLAVTQPIVLPPGSTGAFLPLTGGTVTGATTFSGGLTASAINSTPIGATTPSTGAFTNLVATGTVTLPAGTTGPFLPLTGGLHSIAESGAVGDGVTDDQPAIQAWLNTLTAGAEVLLQPGKWYYVHATSLTIPPHIVIRGAYNARDNQLATAGTFTAAGGFYIDPTLPIGIIMSASSALKSVKVYRAGMASGVNAATAAADYATWATEAVYRKTSAAVAISASPTVIPLTDTSGITVGMPVTGPGGYSPTGTAWAMFVTVTAVSPGVSVTVSRGPIIAIVSGAFLRFGNSLGVMVSRGCSGIVLDDVQIIGFRTGIQTHPGQFSITRGFGDCITNIECMDGGDYAVINDCEWLPLYGNPTPNVRPGDAVFVHDCGGPIFKGCFNFGWQTGWHVENSSPKFHACGAEVPTDANATTENWTIRGGSQTELYHCHAQAAAIGFHFDGASHFYATGCTSSGNLTTLATNVAHFLFENTGAGAMYGTVVSPFAFGGYPNKVPFKYGTGTINALAIHNPVIEDLATTPTAPFIQGNAPFTTTPMLAQGIVYQGARPNGGTSTILPYWNGIIVDSGLNPIPTFTINMPAYPADCQVTEIWFNVGVTAITFGTTDGSAVGNWSTAAPAGSRQRWIYSAAQNKWFPGGAGAFMPLSGGTVTGATTFSAAGTALTVTNNTSLGGPVVLAANAGNFMTVTGGVASTNAINIQQSGTGGFAFGAGTASISAGAATFAGTVASAGANILQAGNATGTNNVIRFTPTVAAGVPSIATIGVDTNIQLDIICQGTGGIRLRSPVGFNNTTPIAKPTVSGAKGSNAALASLMTALAAYGLVVDSTTA